MMKNEGHEAVPHGRDAPVPGRDADKPQSPPGMSANIKYRGRRALVGYYLVPAPVTTSVIFEIGSESACTASESSRT